MIRNYVSRIVAEVVRKLLYPEMVEIRAALARIEQQRSAAEAESEGQKSAADLLRLSEELRRLLEAAAGEHKTQIDGLAASMEAGIGCAVRGDISEWRLAAEERDVALNRQLAELSAGVERSFERIHKRDATQGEKITLLHESAEASLAKLDQDIEQIRSRFIDDLKTINRQMDDLYKIVVKREEHTFLISDVERLKQEVEQLKRDALQQGSEPR